MNECSFKKIYFSHLFQHLVLFNMIGLSYQDYITLS